MIIKSLLDTDLYKFTMQQAVIQHYPDAFVRYELIVRTQHDFPAGFKSYLIEEINSLGSLALTEDEELFLKKSCPYFSNLYIDFLKNYRYDLSEVTVKQSDGMLNCVIEGHWYKAILWEVPLLAIISELYSRLTQPEALAFQSRFEKLQTKAKRLEMAGAHFTDFGTRRRFSFEHHDRVIQICRQYAPSMFLGTSNPYLAMKHDLKAFGTQGHEWFMATGALHGYNDANRIALEKWVDTYKGNLGVALTDTFTSEQFFREFDGKLARVYDGLRQDSGDPFLFADRAIAHYRSFGIDPHCKTIIFSDFLNVDKILEIENWCDKRVKTSYGIGTNLTNDAGVPPLNMVIKLTGIKVDTNWVSTVKLSDDPLKYTGNPDAVKICKAVLGIQ